MTSRPPASGGTFSLSAEQSGLDTRGVSPSLHRAGGASELAVRRLSAKFFARGGPDSESSGGYYQQTREGLTGPFTRLELSEQVLAGSLGAEDLVQAEGFPLWQPVRGVLAEMKPASQPPPPPLQRELIAEPAEPAAPQRSELPTWPVLLSLMGQRLSTDWRNPPPVALGICLAIGALGLAAARFGWLLWLPWFAVVLECVRSSAASRRRVCCDPRRCCALASIVQRPTRNPRLKCTSSRED